MNVNVLWFFGRTFFIFMNLCYFIKILLTFVEKYRVYITIYVGFEKKL
jgi:hypothetical protein